MRDKIKMHWGYTRTLSKESAFWIGVYNSRVSFSIGSACFLKMHN